MSKRFILFIFIVITNLYPIVAEESFKKITETEEIYKEAFEKLSGVWNVYSISYNEFGDDIWDTSWGKAPFNIMSSSLIDFGKNHDYPIYTYMGFDGRITFIKKINNNKYKITAIAKSDLNNPNSEYADKFDRVISIVNKDKGLFGDDIYFKISGPNIKSEIKYYVIKDFKENDKNKFIIRENPSFDSKTIFQTNDILLIIDKSEDKRYWIKVKNEEGIEGWCYIKDIQVRYLFKHNGEKIYYIVSIKDLRFRKSGMLDGKVIRILDKGEKLELISRGYGDTINGIKGNWIKVKTEKGEIGWCFDAYLEEVKDGDEVKKN